MSDALGVSRALAGRRDPREAASDCGFAYRGSSEEGEFTVPFLGAEVTVTFPGLEGDGSVPPHVMTVVLYHLGTSDGAGPFGEWISFADLPDGTFYVDAWKGYTGGRLVAHFGNRVGDVRASLAAIGASETELAADVAAVLPVMPRVPVAFQYWGGDEEWEPRAEFLFDAAASHHLPTDCYAVLTSWLAGRLVQADPRGEG